MKFYPNWKSGSVPSKNNLLSFDIKCERLHARPSVGRPYLAVGGQDKHVGAGATDDH